jgi:hypothetical protein
MYHDDYLNQDDQNDFDEHDADKMFEKVKRQDKGYNVISRKVLKKDGRLYNKKIEIYTSNGTGNRIRDAETGEYFSNLVGSKDEDLFFKVVLATGECRSANGSITVFYSSPHHYASHLVCNVDPILSHNWELKRDSRLSELKKKISPNQHSIDVR